MKYCNNCGHEAPDEDIFCHQCGRRLSAKPPVSHAQPPQGQPSAPQNPSHGNPPEQNQVRYVQVDTRTGRVTDMAADVKRRTRSEAVVKGMLIMFVAITVVIVMVAGSMFIAGHVKQKPSTDADDKYSEISFPGGRADDGSSEAAASETPEPVSSEEEDDVPPELKADYLKSKIKGKWTTKLPYKTMTLPVTFTFDDQGHCSCVIKALFITKQFDGVYTVEDGGRCTLQLEGLEEYMSGGDSITGQAEFVSDNELHFTVGNDVWILNKSE